MNPKQFQSIYESLIGNMFLSTVASNLKHSFYHFYNRKIPSFLQKELLPEKNFLGDLLDGLTPSLQKVEQASKSNLGEVLRNNPRQVLDSSLSGLIIFPSEINSYKLGGEIYRSVEDAAYALEVGVLRAYQFFDDFVERSFFGKIAEKKVKKFFAREKVKDFLGNSGMPSFYEIKNAIKSTKNFTLAFLEYLALSSFEQSFLDEIKARYHKKMASISPRRNVFSYEYEDGIYNGLIEKYNK